MTKFYVIGDTHFGHANILNFKRSNGEPIREFPSIEEHDEALVKNWNSVVKPDDHVYHLGDVVMNKKHLGICMRLNGHKRLVMGNHDIYDAKEYMNAGFKKLHAYRVFPKEGYILSHMPLHPASIKEGWTNVHGHTHSNYVYNDDGDLDDRYMNVSCEAVNYTPRLLFES